MTFRTVSSVAGNATIPTAATLIVASIAPSITGVSPAVGPLAGGIPVTISGTNLSNVSQVDFGATPILAANFLSQSDGAITLDAPAGTAGAVDITVTSPNGADTEMAAFTYGAVPVLTAFTHSSPIPYNAGGATASTINAAVASSPTGSPTRYTISAASANGAVVSVTNAGLLSYTPAAGFRGTDTFGLTASNAFGASAQVTVTVTVANPELVAGGIGSFATVGAPFFANVTLSGGTGPYSAFSATGLPDGLTISPSGTISGTPTSVGTFDAVVVTATDSSTPPFSGPATNARTITVAQGSQTITFAGPGAQDFGTSPTLTATATSGLGVTFTSLTTGVCTVTTDGALTLVTVGSCEIAADQAGDATFAAAAQVTQSFAVGQQGQTIDLPTPEPFGGKSAFVPGDEVSLAARSSSGLPVVFTGLTPQICSISSDGLLTFLKPGTCSIAADQPGNAVVAAAARVVASIQVGGVDPEVEVDLVTNMQVARARSLLFNQPDLSPLLAPVDNESTAINVSTRGADIDLVRMGGPTWMRMSGSMSRQEGGASSGYLQFSLGTHTKLGPNTILGLMGTVDTTRMDDPLGTSEGEGWLVGPYFVSKLGQSALVLEMRALTGRTHDSVAQTGQRASTVWGDRTLVMAKLSGSYQVNEKLALMPALNFAAVNSSSDPYIAAGGTQIAAVRTAYRQQSVDIDWRYEAENSAGKHVFFGGLGWFASQEQQSRAGQGLKYSVGVSQDFGTNSNIRFEVTGARDFDNKTNRLGASLLFNSQF